MAKVTSKRQVTIPKRIADRYGIRAGDELEFVPAGDVIRVITSRGRTEGKTARSRLALFDAATERQRERQSSGSAGVGEPTDRGWKRDELYERG
jgi:AbrB family looped-hinge helix DNA binding protein